jgi:hypothetical protein
VRSVNAQDLKLDYFLMYDIVCLMEKPMALQVTIQGQFDKEPRLCMLLNPDMFALPVSKNGEPICNGNVSLIYYQISQDAKDPARTVTVKNQFGEQKIQMSKAVGLLVPSKTMKDGKKLLGNLDHYKVYRVDEGPCLKERVELQGAFGASKGEVTCPRFFAVPVRKGIGRSWGIPIMNTRAHLVLYQITSGEMKKKVITTDQFGNHGLDLDGSTLFAVPSIKSTYTETLPKGRIEMKRL